MWNKSLTFLISLYNFLHGIYYSCSFPEQLHVNTVDHQQVGNRIYFLNIMQKIHIYYTLLCRPLSFGSEKLNFPEKLKNPLRFNSLCKFKNVYGYEHEMQPQKHFPPPLFFP